VAVVAALCGLAPPTRPQLPSALADPGDFGGVGLEAGSFACMSTASATFIRHLHDVPTGMVPMTCQSLHLCKTEQLSPVDVSTDQ